MKSTLRKYLNRRRLNALERGGWLVRGKETILHLAHLDLSKKGYLSVGNHSIVEASIVIEKTGAKVTIGRNSFLGSSLLASAEKIEVGNDVLISWGCTIVDHNSHSTVFSERSQDVADWARGEKNWEHVKVAPVVIGDRVWVGMNSIILRGVTLGEGCIIGAGSVVTKSIPPWTIAAGNPASVIREIPPNER